MIDHRLSRQNVKLFLCEPFVGGLRHAFSFADAERDFDVVRSAK
jgi:hypothetical protein